MDKKKTGLLLYILATYYVGELLTRAPSIYRLGDKTSHIHPLRFLEVIVKNDRLHRYCNSILQASWLGNLVKVSMKNFLSRRLAQGDLKPYVHDFCNELKLEEQVMQEHIDKKHWYPLIDYILTSSNPENKLSDEVVFSLAEDFKEESMIENK